MMTYHLLADVCIMFNQHDLWNSRHCVKCWGQNGVHNWIWGLASQSLQPVREVDIHYVTTHNMDNFISGKCYKGELQVAGSVCNWGIWHRRKASQRDDEHRAQEEGARSLLSEEGGVEQGGEWTRWRGRWEVSGGGVWRGGGWCELRLVRSVRTYSGCRVQ